MNNVYMITAHIFENEKYSRTVISHVSAPNPHSAKIKAERVYKERGYIPGLSVHVVLVEEVYPVDCRL